MAHGMRPIAQVGKQGATPTLIASIDQAITAHELVKIKFVDFKEERRELTDSIATDLGAEVVSIIGNVAILFREHPDPARRRTEVREQ